MSDRPGIVYVVVNPAWPGWVKVGRAESTKEGMAATISQRLHQFNTGDPRRAYTAHSHYYASCCHTAEQFSHTLLEVGFRRGGGEWFRCSPDMADKFVRRASTIACLRPGARGGHASRALDEVRNKMAGDDTHKIIKRMIEEDTAPKPAKQIEVAETARAAHAVIDALLSQMAMPDENTEAAVRAVQRRLDILGGTV